MRAAAPHSRATTATDAVHAFVAALAEESLHVAILLSLAGGLTQPRA
jgi:hypothetical protein